MDMPIARHFFIRNHDHIRAGKSDSRRAPCRPSIRLQQSCNFWTRRHAAYAKTA
jgi:hypothetical protein